MEEFINKRSHLHSFEKADKIQSDFNSSFQQTEKIINKRQTVYLKGNIFGSLRT